MVSTLPDRPFSRPCTASSRNGLARSIHASSASVFRLVPSVFREVIYLFPSAMPSRCAGRWSETPQYKYTVIVEQDEDGIYVSSVPALQGCYTQGDTYEEAIENIKDAIKLAIEARRQPGEPIPV